MKLLNGVAGLLVFVSFVGNAVADGSNKRTLLDLYRSGCHEQLFIEHPAAVSFATVGDAEGDRFPRLEDELSNLFSTLNSMLDEAGASALDLQEIRISTISSSNRSEIENSVRSDARLRGLPVTFEVVNSLPVSWARIGLFAVGEKAGPFSEPNAPTASPPIASHSCTGSWMIAAR